MHLQMSLPCNRLFDRLCSNYRFKESGKHFRQGIHTLKTQQLCPEGQAGQKLKIGNLVLRI